MNHRHPVLRYVPYTAQSLLALLESPQAFQAVFGTPAAEGLRDFLVSGDVAPEYVQMLRSIRGADPWRLGFAVVDEATRQVVGNASFKGPPDDRGHVEIAYGIVPPCQGRGYATAAAGYLVEFACQHPAVTLLCAHTLPQASPSTRVLQTNGFVHAGQVDDPEDGVIWRWERSATAR